MASATTPNLGKGRIECLSLSLSLFGPTILGTLTPLLLRWPRFRQHLSQATQLKLVFWRRVFALTWQLMKRTPRFCGSGQEDKGSPDVLCLECSVPQSGASRHSRRPLIVFDKAGSDLCIFAPTWVAIEASKEICALFFHQSKFAAPCCEMQVVWGRAEFLTKRVFLLNFIQLFSDWWQKGAALDEGGGGQEERETTSVLSWRRSWNVAERGTLARFLKFAFFRLIVSERGMPAYRQEVQSIYQFRCKISINQVHLFSNLKGFLKQNWSNFFYFRKKVLITWTFLVSYFKIIWPSAKFGFLLKVFIFVGVKSSYKSFSKNKKHSLIFEIFSDK